MFVVVAPLTLPSYEPKDIRQDYSEQLLYSSKQGSSRLVGCRKLVTMLRWINTVSLSSAPVSSVALKNATVSKDTEGKQIPVLQPMNQPARGYQHIPPSQTPFAPSQIVFQNTPLLIILPPHPLELAQHFLTPAPPPPQHACRPLHPLHLLTH